MKKWNGRQTRTGPPRVLLMTSCRHVTADFRYSAVVIADFISGGGGGWWHDSCRRGYSISTAMKRDLELCVIDILRMAYIKTCDHIRNRSESLLAENGSLWYQYSHTLHHDCSSWRRMSCNRFCHFFMISATAKRSRNLRKCVSHGWAHNYILLLLIVFRLMRRKGAIIILYGILKFIRAKLQL